MDIVLIKMPNTIATNMLITFNSKKVRYKIDCCILHTFSLVVKLLLIITIICYDYAKHRLKQEGIDALTI